jgi:hypothetical protein
LAAAAYDHLALSSIMNAAFGIAWVALLVTAIVAAFRKSA